MLVRSSIADSHRIQPRPPQQTCNSISGGAVIRQHVCAREVRGDCGPVPGRGDERHRGDRRVRLSPFSTRNAKQQATSSWVRPVRVNEKAQAAPRNLCGPAARHFMCARCQTRMPCVASYDPNRAGTPGVGATEAVLRRWRSARPADRRASRSEVHRVNARPSNQAGVEDSIKKVGRGYAWPFHLPEFPCGQGKGPLMITTAQT